MLNLGPLKIQKKIPTNINNSEHSKYSIKVYYLCIKNANNYTNNTYKLIKFNNLELRSCERTLPNWDLTSQHCLFGSVRLWHTRLGLELVIYICLDLRPEKEMNEAWECDLRHERGHMLYFD